MCADINKWLCRPWLSLNRLKEVDTADTPNTTPPHICGYLTVYLLLRTPAIHGTKLV